MKDILEKVELAVRRTQSRIGSSSEKMRLMLEMLGDELCRLAMEDSGGMLEDE